MYYYTLLALVLIISPSLAQREAFDINQAYTHLMYSYSAYCPESRLVNWNCFFCNMNVSTAGFKVHTVVQNSPTNTFGYIGDNGKTIVVAFRGTQPDSLENWISDLDIVHTKPYPNVPNAFVHSGFLDAYDVVKPFVRSAVFDLVNSTKATKVVFTGHSLGAAIATLCAADIAPSLKLPYALYNFGSPRVGNLAFTTYFQKIVPTIYRVTNKADTVPHLPDKLMDFHHVAQEVWWNTNTHYNLCDMSGEDPKCANSKLIWSIPDHLHYLDIELNSGLCVTGCCK